MLMAPGRAKPGGIGFSRMLRKIVVVMRLRIPDEIVK
jgi:hypothetical protein